MDFVENIGVGQERAEAGLGAKVDRPAAILGAREICRIGVAEDPPTEGHEAEMILSFRRSCIHRLRVGRLWPLATL